MWRDSPGSCAGKVEGVPCEGSRVVMAARVGRRGFGKVCRNLLCPKASELLMTLCC